MSTASDMVAAYLDAERAVLKGKTVRIGDRQYGKEDLLEIRNGRREWESRLPPAERSAHGLSVGGGPAIAIFGCD